MDLTPLRTSRDFALLLVAGSVFYLGAMVTYVALPYQLYHLTGSNLAVGLMGAVELVPLVVFGLWGGAVADHHDRRAVLVATGVAQVLVAACLLVNAAASHPQVAALYVLGGLGAAASSLQRPSREALVPRVVRHDELPAATALTGLGVQLGMVTGPAIGGLVLARAGAAWAYGVDLVGITVATGLYAALRPAPPQEETAPPSLRGIHEGLVYAMRRKDLLGTYLVDVLAMLLAMPEVIFPAFASSVLRQPDVLGLLYTTITVGSMIATAASRWLARVQHHGRGVVVGAALWGAGIALTGLAPSAWLALPCLLLAGFGDMVSGFFRGVIWNQTIPDELRGRLAGIEMLSYSVGPLGGQVRAGVTADAFGVRTAIVSGGVVCVGAVAVAGAALRSFWSYDARTDRYAVHERRVRAARQAAADAGPLGVILRVVDL